MAKPKTKSAPKSIPCPTCEVFVSSLPPKDRTIPDALRLEEKTGNYVCAIGHTFNVDELRALVSKQLETEIPAQNEAVSALDAAPPVSDGVKVEDLVAEKEFLAASQLSPENGSEVPLDAPQITPELGEKQADFAPKSGENEAISESLFRDSVTALIGLLSNQESSQSLDTTLKLPNGDLLVAVRIVEGHTGPVGELAAAEGQTISNWLSGNLELYLNDVFTNSYGR